MAIKIGIKWVTAIKGTKTKPITNTRFVGKEFSDDTMKGAVCIRRMAPSFEVLGLQVRHSQARKLYRRARRPIFVDVFAEDAGGRRKVLAKLVRSLYGTGYAPSDTDEVRGFVEYLRVPCKFYLGSMDVEVIAHVDDLFVVENLKCVPHGAAEASEVKCKYAGTETVMDEVQYLGRQRSAT